MAVVRATVAVLTRSAAKLRHRQNHYIIHALAEVCVKRSDGCAEVSQQIAELSLLIAFVDVRVPAADVREGDFQPDARFNQLRSLPQSIAERRLRIDRAILSF